MPRGLAVLAVYLAFFLTLAGVGFLLANPISNQVRTFTNNLPHIVNEANKQIATLQNEPEQTRHPRQTRQARAKRRCRRSRTKSPRAPANSPRSAAALLTEVASAIFDLVLVFVLSVYMLIYGERSASSCARRCPPATARPPTTIRVLVQHAVSRYVGGQLLFSVIMGASAGVALYLFGCSGSSPTGASMRSRSASSTA